MANITQLDLGSVNAYLLSLEDGYVLFDCGGFLLMDKELNSRWEPLEKKLVENGCFPGNLKYVLLTHGDVDHVANCKKLQEMYGAKVVIHELDLHLLSEMNEIKVLHNFRFKSLMHKIVFRLMFGTFIKRAREISGAYDEFIPDIVITNDTDMEKFGINASLIHVPGHTRGSIGILFDDGSFIAGDTLTNFDRPTVALNALAFDELEEGVKMLKERKISIVYPGHGEPFTFDKLKH